MAPNRRNPSGDRGLRAYAASFLVNDGVTIASSSLLACASQDPVARPTTLSPRPASLVPSGDDASLLIDHDLTWRHIGEDRLLPDAPEYAELVGAA